MEKTKLDYINTYLVVILVLLFILNFSTKFQHKEQDKILWDAKIYSSNENTSSEISNLIKIESAVFYNNFNKSTKTLNNDSFRQKSGIISEINQGQILFGTYEKELLPDSLNLKYFSVNERKFYLVSTKLSYEKIKSFTKNSTINPTLIIEILPKGKTILKINIEEPDSQNSRVIETFTATETIGNLDALVNKESSEGKYNGYDDIKNINDFSDLLENKYKWVFKSKIDSSTYIKEVSAYSYSEENINLFGKTQESLPIPSQFYIKWGDKQEFGVQYTFNPLEILNAFRTLNTIESSEPISINFKLFEYKYPHCEISKGIKNITLRDIYPEKPIRYAR